jgi:L-seryl-tRNA(Ser) seleniumtransferase
LHGEACGDTSQALTPERAAQHALAWIDRTATPGLRRVVNATGVVLHTNLGRAPLARAAIDALTRAAGEPCALEIDLASGARGERDAVLVPLLQALTGAEAGLAVNNNAAALLLALDTLAHRREVVVSRGELIEIGGSFRLPEILSRSGAVLREVGTTNRTRVADYAEALSRRSGAILKVHPSNYRIGGFTAEATVAELAELARKHSVPLIEDLGSGALVDLSAYGLPHEPVVCESIRAGADLVTFSGDKLLGGPQAGLVVGRADLIESMRRNPLKRALRLGKLTLAALAATLDLYRRATDLRAVLPGLYYLTRPPDELERLAEEGVRLLRQALPPEFELAVAASQAEVGSGAQPTIALDSRCVVVKHATWPAERVAAFFRGASPPILGRVHHDRLLLDVRAVARAEDLVPQVP